MQKKKNNFSDILLQESPSNILRHSFESGRIAQTYLFAGKQSVGRMVVAKAFSALLQCKNPVKDENGRLDLVRIFYDFSYAVAARHYPIWIFT